MSTKTMTITDIAKSPKSFKDTHTLSVGGFKPQTDKIPEWFNKFHKEEFVPLRDAFIQSQSKAPEWFLEFKKENDERWARQEEFNKLLLSRLDNLVTKNNLKE